MTADAERESRAEGVTSGAPGGGDDPPPRSRLAKYAHDVRTFPGDAAAAWRRAGLAGAWAELAERTLYRVYRRGRMIVIEQHLATVRDVPAPAGVRIAPFAGPDWTVLAPIATTREQEHFRRAAARDRVCLVAWRDERPVGYTWYSERIDPEIERFSMPLPRDATYHWNLYVAPSERNSGIGSALVSARLHLARERGFRLGWRMISPRNGASLRTLAKTSGPGTRIVGEMTYVKRFARLHTRFVANEAAAADDAAAS